MRYAKDHKERTRQHVVEVASHAFRRDGIVASGVVGLMGQAGLTQGGFYTHFSSKDELVEEALVLAQKSTLRKIAARTAKSRDSVSRPLDDVIDGYLSEAHMNAPDTGCTLASVGAEIGRQSEAVRRSTFATFADTIDALALIMPPEKKDAAAALYGLLAGTLQLARLAGTRSEQLAILESGRAAAHLIAGWESETPKA